MQRLPLVCPGLLQRKRRNGEVSTTYTGVVLLEVGGLTEAGDVERVKARAAGWPTTLAAFTGASGRTVKILVSGTLDDGTLPKEPEGIARFHRRLYEMSARAYASVVGRPLQAKNAQPDNTFRWTYDAQPFLNTTAAPIRILRRDILQSGRGGVLLRNPDVQESTSALQACLQTRYDLRFNELTNCVEWRSVGSASAHFLPLDSRMMNTMIQEARESGLRFTDRDMKRYLGSTRVRSYHPARDYLQSVRGSWDGRTDHIGQLADRVQQSNPLWRKCFHSWFLGLVGQWNNPTEGRRKGVAPLIIGPQGCGKSAFTQLLLPPELRAVGFHEAGDFVSKSEIERQLTSSLLIHLNVNNHLSGKAPSWLQHDALQMSSVRGRRPFSTELQELPRYASFIATASTSSILVDIGCPARFFVVELRKGQHIEIASSIPYSQLYDQVISELEAEAQRHDFTPEVVAELEAYNSRYVNARVEVLRFLDTFELTAEPRRDSVRMKLSDIADAVRRHTGFSYSDKAFNYLGRWLTNEAKMSHVRKTVSNGSPVYLLRPLYK